ncbi:alpha/beta hydrolase [Fictibacillus barbaricus]|uniref:Esterase n=1 Tax=Fictibacillus barbaricus TaxID=182136 RepID=A0ABS2ZH38_9BACL|nr:alpha/beta hydrolase-fold protein [Fictibacillus barbaricus]MBN3546643.1 hypothetical protein [Fictibacillus barbaricus]GGB42632.1 hypothetical protein GCM10007199_04940 [Fictibacillus barbaricus]
MISYKNINALESAKLKRRMKVKLYFYEVQQSTQVDVLFVQDGEDYEELGKIRESMKHHVNNQTISENLLLVLVHPGDSYQRWNFYHPNGKEHIQYKEFFSQELFTYVENWLSNKKLHIRKLGTIGDSLGAVISTYLVAEVQKPWTHLLLQSAAYEKHMETLLEISIFPSNLQIYQVVGKKEVAFNSPITGNTLYILNENRTFHQRFKQLGIRVAYHEEEEDHLWDFWRRDLPRALSFFLNN